MDNKNGPAAPNNLDPDLAELLSIEEPAAPAAGGPEFGALFKEEAPPPKAAEVVDGSRKRFDPIARFEEDPKPYFEDKDYYKTALAGEGDCGARLHDVLGKFMKATEIEEKSKLRSQAISAYWELGSSISARAAQGFPTPKRLLLRFGILSPTFLTSELRSMVSRIIFENAEGEPIYYLDEWLEAVAAGKVRPSSTDEVKQVQKDAGRKLIDELEKKKGQRDAEITILRGKVAQLDEHETGLREQVGMLLKHEVRPEIGGLKSSFTPAQKAAMTQVQDLLRQIAALDAQISASYAEIAGFDKELEVLARKSEGVVLDNSVDAKTVVAEYQVIRQMAKMSVGRKGNHFPVFLSQFVRPVLKELGTRENVIAAMAEVEALDPGLFMRTHKQTTARIVPNTILLPSYGDTGLCWEPFEKFNRATSRGRIAIPMFGKNLQVAVLTALADLRWQVAKEKAAYYWMEEGLTGKYYQWFTERKLKGDVREYFMRDYMLWVSKESIGMQKLDRDVRGIFWRMMPFPQDIKDNLRNRGFVYNELYKKDQNIARSDGY